MNIIYENLLENSLHAALSSIEIYNKPDFKYREQIFTILNINSWELMLKAKILKDSSDNLESLYITLSNGTFKKNRTGNPMTLEIIGAMWKVSLNPIITNNLEKLIEVRDTVVHFYHDEALSYIIYILGVASLRNYQKLINEWFGKSLLEYNFYILPLGFAYNFKTLSMLELGQKPEAISNLINSVAETQSATEPSEGFHFVCEITTTIISTKKITADDADFVTMVDPEANPDTVIVERLQRLTDKYPLSFKQVWERIKTAKPTAKQKDVYRIIKEHKIKENSKLSSYNFRTKAQRENYEKTGALPSAPTSIYNDDAVRYIIENLVG